MNVDRFKLIEKINTVKKNYTFQITEKRKLPIEVFERFGYPAYFEKVKNGFLVLFSNKKTQLLSIIFFSDGVQDTSIVIQSQFITTFCCHYSSGRIFVCENSFEGLLNGNNELSLYNKNNQIVEYDINGNVTNVIASSQEKQIFPMGISVDSQGQLTYFDMIKGAIILLNSYWEILKIIDIGKRIAIRTTILENSSEIYFLSLSKINWFNINTEEMADKIYRARVDGDVEPLYSACFTGPPNNQLSDFKICGKNIIYCGDQFFGKTDLSGNNIFQLSKSNPVWCYGEKYVNIVSLTKDPIRNNTLYCLCWADKQFLIYEFLI